ncbi:hypothetical protein GALMADRAFT_281643 [Galerina marginata CBS 339.88]|uniref:CCAAT-binding factor domain-containing protein n=1 Tax=Galerina marginata (strain CBS 339.88) TaxID=685588 RepID=A0A067SLL9_GALM3|nr:hypothetical protein GALMADRAFT_281643 [Galerina marginata CBS 339.88]
MGRLRKEKGKSSSLAKQSAVPKPSHKTNTKNGKKSSISRDQVLAMGGNEEDMDLLKDVDENTVSGSPNKDPALQKDISKFLKDLNLKGSQPDDTPKSKGKGKEKAVLEKAPAKAAPEKSSKKKEKKASVQTTAPAPSERDEERPKVQLPTKVSLNPKSTFIFQPTSQWYTAMPPLAPTSSPPTISPTQLSSLSEKATSLHEADTRTFQTSSSANSSSSEASFLSKIIQSGTLSDRLSALTLLVQSSPLHNIRALETLRGMAERGKGKGGREESLKALRCIVDWWVGGGAPDRKLVYFRDQALLHPGVTDERLLVWHFEDWLKKYFFSVLQILETLSLDPLPYVRTQTINLIFTLLRDKPEQEQNLLRLLVNKLGDTEKSLASRASYHILQLLQSHPAMKGIIVREIVALILRPPASTSASTSTSTSTASGAPNKHIRFDNTDSSKPKPKPAAAGQAEKKPGTTNANAHARYYATVTFNQIVLTPADRGVALQLIDVYFEMFKELLGAGVEDVGREEGEGEKGEKEKEFRTDKGGRVRDGGKDKGTGKGKGKQGEVKGAAGFTEVEDSNSRLVSAILTGVNRALPFAKIDAGDSGINKHIDTLFLITHTSTFNISLQALVLMQQITASLSPTPASTSSSTSTAKSIVDRYYRTLYASLQDTRLATSSKQAMYLNLFFKSVKAAAGNKDGDGHGERVKALVRRFVQVLVSGGGGATEFVAGGLFLLGELFSSIPGLRAMINEKPKEAAEPYDPRKRDPQFAHASALPLWELTPLLNHYHPAIALHARQLLASQPLTASADLSQNTLSHFLDRFVYKNPKKVKEGENAGAGAGAGAKGKGASAMQPAASALEGVKLVKGELGEAVLNEVAFLRKRVGDVPVDQLFFHQYFRRKDEREKAKAAKVKKRKEGMEGSDEEDEDEGEEDEKEEDENEIALSEGADPADAASEVDEDEDSDLEEAEIWKAMQATMPKVTGEDDDLMQDSDLEDEDEDDDDLPLDFDDDSELNEAGDSEDEESQVAEDEDDGEDDGLSLAEASDNEDLIQLDEDMPDGLIEYDGSDADVDEDDAGNEEEVWGGISTAVAPGKKRKREETKNEKRKKLRSLPTFASYEDYAKLIEEGPEDDI